MTMRNFIKCMACNIDQKKKKGAILDRLGLRLDWLKKKKKNCVTNWGKNG